MTLHEVKTILDARVLCCEEFLDREVLSACGSDFMSDVLAYVKDQPLLLTGLVKLEQVENAADFLIGIMSPMFIPAAVALMDQFTALRAILMPFFIICFVGLVTTLGVTGRVTQFFLQREKEERK